MSPTQTNGGPFDARVLVEVSTGGVFRRVNVWSSEGHTFIAFAPDTTEEEAKEIVSRGLGLLRPLDVTRLFREGKKRRRFIDPD